MKQLISVNGDIELGEQLLSTINKRIETDNKSIDVVAFNNPELSYNKYRKSRTSIGIFFNKARRKLARNKLNKIIAKKLIEKKQKTVLRLLKTINKCNYRILGDIN